MLCVALTGVCCALAQAAAAGGVLYVDDDAPAGGNGQSWNTAYRFLRDAIAHAAQPGSGVDEIRVGQGLYMPDRDEANPNGTGDRSASFHLVNGVAIEGGYAGFGAPEPDERDIVQYLASLSGDLAGDDGPGFANNDENAFHAVTGDAVDPTAEIDGFTIRGGNADGPDPDDKSGGGIRIVGGAPTVRQCTITGNSAIDHGGGVFNFDSSPLVEDCALHGNQATGDPWIVSAHGGGMSNVASHPTIDGCWFAENVILTGYGGGMSNTEASHPIITGCVFQQNDAYGYGGGMYNKNSNPIITDCTFLDHGWPFIPPSALDGGAMYNDSSHPAIIACSFICNGSISDGGGICNVASSPDIIGCSFHLNGSDDGGAICNDESEPLVIDCTFSDNGSAFVGGAILDRSPSGSIVVNCAFIGNSASSCGGAFHNAGGNPIVLNSAFVGNYAWLAGGAFGGGGSFVVINCLFSGNVADSEGGGGMVCGGLSTPFVTNCTFSANESTLGVGGGLLIMAGASLTCTNSILWGNTHWGPPGQNAQITINNGSADVNHTCIEGLTGSLGGVGNIGDDPLFANPAVDDCHLLPGSPCIDAGHDNAVPADAHDLDNDGDLDERMPHDLDGAPRFADDPATPDTGCGAPVIVDMGAYEFPGASVNPVLIGDLGGDGVVNVIDLLALLAAWGPCSADCCPADLDLDGTIDVIDLVELLAHWS